MPSPFPGMDPFIESCGLFEDFHDDLLIQIKMALAARLPRGYVARTGERSYIVLAAPEDEPTPQMKPDVTVFTTPGKPKKARRKGGTAVVKRRKESAGPIPMRALVATEFRETFVEVRELRGDNRLVSCLEVLSPSNKRADSPGHARYLRKRQALLTGSAHFIEIDLLRGGERMPMEDPWPDSPYYSLVCRKQKAPLCDVWPAFSVELLPTIPIPLLAPDPDVELDLNPLIAEVYRHSGYDQSIDYRRPPAALLGDKEAAWLRERLRQQRA